MMSGLGWNERRNADHEGGRNGGLPTASARFRECDFNVNLIKSEAVPIIQTLLQHFLGPHALVHLRGSAGVGDSGSISTAETKKSSLAPDESGQFWVTGLPDVSCLVSSRLCMSSGGSRDTRGVSVNEFVWG